MIRLSPEAKVGLFVLLGIILLVYMSLKVGGIKIGRGEGYDLIVRFDNVGGLDIDAPVRVAGVEVGRVRDLRLEDNKARVILRLNPEVQIGKDFTALIKTQGLLGEKYVELIPGSPETPSLEPGGEITRTRVFADIDRLIAQLNAISEDVKKVTTSMSKVLGGDKGEVTLRNIVKNIEELSINLNRTIAANDEKFNRMMTNFETFSRTLRENGPQIAENLKIATKNINEVIEENRGNIKDSLAKLKTASERLDETLSSLNRLATRVEPKLEGALASVQNVAEKIERGEGTIGKLVTEEETVDKLNETLAGVNEFINQGKRFKTFIGFRGEYLFDAGDSKNFVTLRIQPRADKYYLFELIDDPRNRIQFDRSGQKEPADKIRFSAQIAKRFHNLTLRGGMIESTGGIGLDYYLLGDRLRFTFEASDFDDNRRPFLKMAATYNLNKYFFLTGGYSDILSRQGLETPFLGAGLRFEDEDLKYLLMNAPIP